MLGCAGAGLAVNSPARAGAPVLKVNERLLADRPRLPVRGSVFPGSCGVNKLYFGDNLDVLREKVKDETVDLVYLDPPFNSDANYNVLFKAAGGHASGAQAEAFRDTWDSGGWSPRRL